MSQTHEEFFAQRAEKLKADLEAVCQKRDALTFDLVLQNRYLKEALFKRQAIVSGAFGNFVSVIADHHRNNGTRLQCDEATREMLLSWRRQAETISDIGKLLSFIEEKVEEIEDMSNLQLIPLCRMDEAIGQALQVSSAPQPPIPGPINTGDVLPQAVGPGFSY